MKKCQVCIPNITKILKKYKKNIKKILKKY